MRKTQTQKLSDIVMEYLKNNQLDQKIKESNVKKYWENLMGKLIAEKTNNIYIKNRTLFISLNSSILRNDLIMMRSRIIKLMNEQMGGDYIEDVKIR